MVCYTIPSVRESVSTRFTIASPSHEHTSPMAPTVATNVAILVNGIKSNQILFVTYTWLADVNASVAKCLCF